MGVPTTTPKPRCGAVGVRRAVLRGFQSRFALGPLGENTQPNKYLAELADLTTRQLKARAKEAGASGDAIDDLDDAPDFKAAVIDLIVSLELA